MGWSYAYVSITIATVVIAYYAYASYKLSIQMKEADKRAKEEAHETSIDILTAALMGGKFGSQTFEALEAFKILRTQVKEIVKG